MLSSPHTLARCDPCFLVPSILLLFPPLGLIVPSPAMSSASIWNTLSQDSLMSPSLLPSDAQMSSYLLPNNASLHNLLKTMPGHALPPYPAASFLRAGILTWQLHFHCFIPLTRRFPNLGLCLSTHSFISGTYNSSLHMRGAQ